MARLQPLIYLSSPLSSIQIVEGLGNSLRAPEASLKGLTAVGRIELHVPTREVNFWSPQLVVDLSDTNEGCDLKGRFGPHPSVWTMYMAGYAATAFFTLLSISFAYAQWVMEQNPWALAGLPISLLIASALYGLAFVGQHREEGQMRKMEDFLRNEVTKCEDTLVRLERSAS